jgi:hypothetical protein
MPQVQEERIARHLTLLAEGVERLGEHPPRSSEELEMQRLFADTAVEVALAVVCELLPSELQPTARRLSAPCVMPSGIEGSNPKEVRSYEALCSTQTGERVQNPQLSRSGLPPAIVHNSDHVEVSAACRRMAARDR